MVIAGVDGSTGEILYRRGFDPVSQTMNLDAIDQQCQRLTDYLKHFKKAGMEGVSLENSSSDYMFGLARNSQERSTSLARASQQSRSSGDYGRAEIAGMQSRIESSFAKSELQSGMILDAFQRGYEQAVKYTQPERTRLNNLLDSRHQLIKTYKEQQQVGDYITKKWEEGDSIGFAVVHVPSGTVNYGFQSKSEDEGIILNPEQNEYYYHERLLITEPEKNPDNISNPKATYGLYLVAVPLVKHE
jgi:hypothetical protein